MQGNLKQKEMKVYNCPIVKQSLVVVVHEMLLMFWHFKNTTGYHLRLNDTSPFNLIVNA